jgi:hypothetical protein
MRKVLAQISLIAFAVLYLQGCQSNMLYSFNDAQDLCQDFQVVETQATANTQLTRDTAVNQSDYLKAYIACLPISGTITTCQDRLFVEDIATQKAHELKATCFLPWRPFSNLAWTTDTILVFEQWANPSFGHRFTVDISNGKMLETVAIH